MKSFWYKTVITKGRQTKHVVVLYHLWMQIYSTTQKCWMCSFMLWQLSRKKQKRLTSSLIDAKPRSSKPVIHPHVQQSGWQRDKLKSSIHISIRGYDWLLWCQQRWGPAEDKHCLDLYEFAGKMDLEVQYPAGYQDRAISDLCSVSLGCETWARTRYLRAQIDIFHTCARLRSWQFIFSSYIEHRSQGSVKVSQHGNGVLSEILWSHCMQFSQWRPSLCSCCCNSQAPAWPQNTPRKTQSHMAQSHGVWAETIFLRTLVFDSGHGYAQDE